MAITGLHITRSCERYVLELDDTRPIAMQNRKRYGMFMEYDN